jgi:flavin-dependent dehydrogenase
VTSRALAIVAGARPLARIEAVTIECARFVDSPSGSAATVPLSAADDTRLVVASRRDFDGQLLDAARAAGAHFHPLRVRAVRRDGSRWLIDAGDGRTFRAGFLVGADGANSLVRRTLTRPFGREDLSIATGFFAHGVTSAEIVIELVADPPGYIWSFPRPDHLAIGVCTQGNAGVTSARLRAMTADWIRTTGIASGARLSAYSWPIPSLSSRAIEALTAAGPGWCLIGDAAGLVDPITREGIFFALQSAEIAAGAIGASSNPEHEYREHLWDTVLDELQRAAELKDRFFRPRFTHLLLRALASSVAVRGVMADLIAGTQTYRGLKSRLLRTLELRLAWDLLHV